MAPPVDVVGPCPRLGEVECNIPKTFLDQKLIYGAWMWERVVGR
jgi:hypothetical protein